MKFARYLVAGGIIGNILMPSISYTQEGTPRVTRVVEILQACGTEKEQEGQFYPNSKKERARFWRMHTDFGPLTYIDREQNPGQISPDDRLRLGFQEREGNLRNLNMGLNIVKAVQEIEPNIEGMSRARYAGAIAEILKKDCRNNS